MTRQLEASEVSAASPTVAQIVADHKRTVVQRCAIILGLIVAAVVAFVVSTIVGN